MLPTMSPVTNMFMQTSQLPEDDRYSVSMKEYLAEIDVCMGGRVAEELSKCYILLYCLPLHDDPSVVYGTDNVTSGCSSDIRKATAVARAMVKVGHNCSVLFASCALTAYKLHLSLSNFKSVEFAV